MSNGIFTLDWKNVKSAIIYGLLLGIVAIGTYVYQNHSIFGLDWHQLVDAFVFGFGGGIFKNLLTTNDGNFLGMVKTVSPTDE